MQINAAEATDVQLQNKHELCKHRHERIFSTLSNIYLQNISKNFARNLGKKSKEKAPVADILVMRHLIPAIWLPRFDSWQFDSRQNYSRQNDSRQNDSRYDFNIWLLDITVTKLEFKEIRRI